MRVTFVTAELSPVATVGGLAAAAAGLCGELRHQGIDVDLVMPDYGNLALVDETMTELVVPTWVGAASMRVGTHPDVGRLHLISVPGMARSHPYQQPDGEGWPDNSARFFRFSRAVASLVAHDPPTIVHLNDWHTGSVLAALGETGPPSVLSIHNLAYQGVTGPEWLQLIGPRAAHFEWWGNINPLSGAIALADRIVAVSPNYAREIVTAEGGFGLDEPLRSRGDALTGILNGIDTDVWNPAADRHLPTPFDRDSIDDRALSRAALLTRFGMVDDGLPVAAVVTRLTHQKGIDILLPIIPLLEQIPLKLVVLGSGDAVLAAELRRLADADPARVGFIDGYDESLSHLMFAGSDLFVMPSRFEPCGLTQMQAMRYGSIPIVTAVGGLVDTVPDADAAPLHGLGFVADQPDPLHLLAALQRGVRRLRDRRRHRALQRRMMGVDWSWREPARTYIDLYRELGA